MTPEQLIHAYADAWNRRDAEAIRSLAHESAEYVNAPGAVEPGTRHGPDGLVKVAQAQWEILDSVEILRIDGLGDQLVAVQRVTATIPGSASQLQTDGVVRWTFEDGAIRRIEILGAGSSFQEGLRAAGLEGSP